MTADDKRISELVTKVETARDFVKRIEDRIAWAKKNQHGRGAADSRVGLYYAECELEAAQLELGDELFDEAAALYLWRAA